MIHTWCISKECYCDGGRFAAGGEKRTHTHTHTHTHTVPRPEHSFIHLSPALVIDTVLCMHFCYLSSSCSGPHCSATFFAHHCHILRAPLPHSSCTIANILRAPLPFFAHILRATLPHASAPHCCHTCSPAYLRCELHSTMYVPASIISFFMLLLHLLGVVHWLPMPPSQ